jgi:hypothetical protein
MSWNSWDNKRFDHARTDCRVVDHHGKNFGRDFGHKSVDSHKSFGGGMSWQPTRMTWSFGGKAWH